MIIETEIFLAIPAFDQKYWESEERPVIENINKNFGLYEFSDSINSLEVPDTSNPVRLSLYYHLKALNSSHLPDRFELMKKAADLGNPYAMIFIADISEDEAEIQKYIKLAYDIGFPEGITRYVINYIKEEYKVDELEEITAGNNDPILPELETRILSDLSRVSKKERSQTVIGLCLEIYTVLYYESSDKKYIDQLMYYKLRNNDLNSRAALGEDIDEIKLIIERNYEKNERIEKLEKENLELRKAYDELKKLKELDFNNLISNGVGEYLMNS